MPWFPLVFLLLFLPLARAGSAEKNTGASGSSGSSSVSRLSDFEELQAGNERFVQGRAHAFSFAAPVRLPKHPSAVLLTCSDSRVPPEQIFDQGPGFLYVVSLPGGVVSPEALAGIEYAVTQQGAKMLLVMGHERCETLNGALRGKMGFSSESADALSAQARKAMVDGGPVSAGKGAEGLARASVTASLKSILRRSELVRQAVTRNHLILGQALYSLETGRVEFWDIGAKVEMAGVTDAPLIREQIVKEEIIPEPAALRRPASTSLASPTSPKSPASTEPSTPSKAH